MADLLQQIEEFKTQNQKRSLLKKKKKLGYFVKKRVGIKFVDIWEDGLDFIKIKKKFVYKIFVLILYVIY